jgi:hypothetical protein
MEMTKRTSAAKAGFVGRLYGTAEAVPLSKTNGEYVSKTNSEYVNKMNGEYVSKAKGEYVQG